MEAYAITRMHFFGLCWWFAEQETQNAKEMDTKRKGARDPRT